MKTFGLLALSGAMGLKFEDLSYNNLRDAFTKVKYIYEITMFILTHRNSGSSRRLRKQKPRYCHHRQWLPSILQMVRRKRRWICRTFWIRSMRIKIRILVPIFSRMVWLGHLRNLNLLGILSNHDEIHGQHWPWPLNVSRPIRIRLALRCNDPRLCWSCFRTPRWEQGWQTYRYVTHLYHFRLSFWPLPVELSVNFPAFLKCIIQEMNTNYGQSSQNAESMFLSQKLEIMLSSLPPLECHHQLLKIKSLHTFQS